MAWEAYLLFLFTLLCCSAVANPRLESFRFRCTQSIATQNWCSGSYNASAVPYQVAWCNSAPQLNASAEGNLQQRPIVLAGWDGPLMQRLQARQPQLQQQLPFAVSVQRLGAATDSLAAHFPASPAEPAASSPDAPSSPTDHPASTATETDSAFDACVTQTSTSTNGAHVAVAGCAAGQAPWTAAPGADAWLVDSRRLGEAQLTGHVAELSYSVLLERSLGWTSIQQRWRSMAGYYNRTAYAVPLGGSALHLLYRADVLAAHSASVPATWHELLALAARLHGTPMPINTHTLKPTSTSSSTSSPSDGNDAHTLEEEEQQDARGAGQSWAWGSGLCLDVRPGCCSQELLLAAWAPLAVSKGASSGLLFHVPYMTPQLDTEAFREALVTYGAASVLGASVPAGYSGGRSGGGGSSGCAACGASGDVRGSVAAALAAAAGRAVHPAFAAGRCALTVASTEAVKALLVRRTEVKEVGSFSSNSGSGDVGIGVGVRSEWVGIAQLPGSAWVLNQSSEQLVLYDAVLRKSRADGGGSSIDTPTTRGPMTLEEALGAAATAASAGVPTSATVPARVNRAPVMGWGTTVGVVSARVEPWQQARALELLGRLAGSEGSWALVSDEQVPLGPVRVEQQGAAATALLGSREDGSSAAGVGVGGGDRGRGSAPGDWDAAGYDAAAVRRLLAAAAEAADHPNAVPPLVVPRAEQVMCVLQRAADAMAAAAAAAAAATHPPPRSLLHQEDQQPAPRQPQGRRLTDQSDSSDAPPLPSLSPEALASLRTTAARIAASAQAQVALLYGWDEQRVGLRLPVATAPVAPDGTTGPGPWTAATEVELSLALVRQPYLASIGYSSTAPLVDLSPPDPAPRRGTPNGVMFIQVGVPIMAITSVVLTVLLILNTHNARGKAYYAVDAPPVGPETTLLVTDVQDSTVLWEQLPADVMDMAMQVHHVTVRRHLVQYNGYEASTEGDSFILAFYDANEALRYALATQQALLEAKWPDALLAMEGCSSVWAAPTAQPKPEPLLPPLARRMLLPGLLPQRPSLTLNDSNQQLQDGGSNTAATNTLATNTVQSLRVPSMPLRTTSGIGGGGGGGGGSPNAWSLALGSGQALWRKATRRAGPTLGGGGGQHQGLASGEWGPHMETWAVASGSNGGGSGGGGWAQQPGPVRQQALGSHGSPTKSLFSRGARSRRFMSAHHSGGGAASGPISDAGCAARGLPYGTSSTPASPTALGSYLLPQRPLRHPRPSASRPHTLPSHLRSAATAADGPHVAKPSSSDQRREPLTAAAAAAAGAAAAVSRESAPPRNPLQTSRSLPALPSHAGPVRRQVGSLRSQLGLRMAAAAAAAGSYGGSGVGKGVECSTSCQLQHLGVGLEAPAPALPEGVVGCKEDAWGRTFSNVEATEAGAVYDPVSGDGGGTGGGCEVSEIGLPSAGAALGSNGSRFTGRMDLALRALRQASAPAQLPHQDAERQRSAPQHSQQQRQQQQQQSPLHPAGAQQVHVVNMARPPVPGPAQLGDGASAAAIPGQSETPPSSHPPRRTSCSGATPGSRRCLTAGNSTLDNAMASVVPGKAVGGGSSRRTGSVSESGVEAVTGQLPLPALAPELAASTARAGLAHTGFKQRAGVPRPDMDTGLLGEVSPDNEDALLVPSEVEERPVTGAQHGQVAGQLVPAAVFGTAPPLGGPEAAVAAGGAASAYLANLTSAAPGNVGIGSGDTLGSVRWGLWLSNPTASGKLLGEQDVELEVAAAVACSGDPEQSSPLAAPKVALQLPPEAPLHPHPSGAALRHGHGPGVGEYSVSGGVQTGALQYRNATEEITPCVDDDIGLGGVQAAVCAPPVAGVYTATKIVTAEAPGAAVSSVCGAQAAQRGAGPDGGGVRRSGPALWQLPWSHLNRSNQNSGSNLNPEVRTAMPLSLPPLPTNTHGARLTGGEPGAGVVRAQQQLRVRRSLEAQYASATLPIAEFWVLPPGQLLGAPKEDQQQQEVEVGVLASGPAQPAPWAAPYYSPGAHPSSGTAAHVPMCGNVAAPAQDSDQATTVGPTAPDSAQVTPAAAHLAALATLSDLPRAPYASEGSSPAPITSTTFLSSLANAHAIHPLTAHVASAAVLPGAPNPVPTRLRGTPVSTLEFPAPASLPSSYHAAVQASIPPYGSHYDAGLGFAGSKKPYGFRTAPGVRQMTQWLVGSGSMGLMAANGACEGGGVRVGMRRQASRGSGGGAKGLQKEEVQEGSAGGGTARGVLMALAASAEQRGGRSSPGASEEDGAVPFHAVIASRWVAVPPSTPGAVLVLQGLRVRMGLHSGVASGSEMTYNRAAARMMYCGQVLHCCKAVSDCAQGGQIALSGATFANLSHWMINAADTVSVWYGGRHLVKDDLPAQDIFIAYSRQLLGRAALLPPGLRSKTVLLPPMVEGLVGPVVVAMLVLHRPQQLQALPQPLGQQAHHMVEVVALQLMRLLGGSLYESENGAILCGFTSARAAVLWLLHSQALLLAVPWDPRVADCPAWESRTYNLRRTSGASTAGAAAGTKTVTISGPRVKGVVDLSTIPPDIHRASGRLYIPMRARQRMQQLLSVTRPGQVVCSSMVEAAFAAEALASGTTAATAATTTTASNALAPAFNASSASRGSAASGVVERAALTVTAACGASPPSLRGTGERPPFSASVGPSKRRPRNVSLLSVPLPPVPPVPPGASLSLKARRGLTGESSASAAAPGAGTGRGLATGEGAGAVGAVGFETVERAERGAVASEGAAGVRLAAQVAGGEGPDFDAGAESATVDESGEDDIEALLLRSLGNCMADAATPAIEAASPAVAAAASAARAAAPVGTRSASLEVLAEAPLHLRPVRTVAVAAGDTAGVGTLSPAAGGHAPTAKPAALPLTPDDGEAGPQPTEPRGHHDQQPNRSARHAPRVLSHSCPAVSWPSQAAQPPEATPSATPASQQVALPNHSLAAIFNSNPMWQLADINEGSDGSLSDPKVSCRPELSTPSATDGGGGAGEGSRSRTPVTYRVSGGGGGGGDRAPRWRAVAVSIRRRGQALAHKLGNLSGTVRRARTSTDLAYEMAGAGPDAAESRAAMATLVGTPRSGGGGGGGTSESNASPVGSDLVVMPRSRGGPQPSRSSMSVTSLHAAAAVQLLQRCGRQLELLGVLAEPPPPPPQAQALVNAVRKEEQQREQQHHAAGRSRHLLGAAAAALLRTGSRMRRLSSVRANPSGLVGGADEVAVAAEGSSSDEEVHPGAERVGPRAGTRHTRGKEAPCDGSGANGHTKRPASRLGARAGATSLGIPGGLGRQRTLGAGLGVSAEAGARTGGHGVGRRASLDYLAMTSARTMQGRLPTDLASPSAAAPARDAERWRLRTTGRAHGRLSIDAQLEGVRWRRNAITAGARAATATGSELQGPEAAAGTFHMANVFKLFGMDRPHAPAHTQEHNGGNLPADSAPSPQLAGPVDGGGGRGGGSSHRSLHKLRSLVAGRRHLSHVEHSASAGRMQPGPAALPPPPPEPALARAVSGSRAKLPAAAAAAAASDGAAASIRDTGSASMPHALQQPCIGIPGTSLHHVHRLPVMVLGDAATGSGTDTAVTSKDTAVVVSLESPPAMPYGQGAHSEPQLDFGHSRQSAGTDAVPLSPPASAGGGQELAAASGHSERALVNSHHPTAPSHQGGPPGELTASPSLAHGPPSPWLTDARAGLRCPALLDPSTVPVCAGSPAAFTSGSQVQPTPTAPNAPPHTAQSSMAIATPVSTSILGASHCLPVAPPPSVDRPAAAAAASVARSPLATATNTLAEEVLVSAMTAAASPAAASETRRPLVFATAPPPPASLPLAAEVLAEVQASRVTLAALEPHRDNVRVTASLGGPLFLCLLDATGVLGIADCAPASALQPDASEVRPGPRTGTSHHPRALGLSFLSPASVRNALRRFASRKTAAPLGGGVPAAAAAAATGAVGAAAAAAAAAVGAGPSRFAG